MKLYIVRHGETPFNKKKLIQGHFDVDLNKVGLEQTKFLAKRLSNVKFDFIYSSDLLRAKKTTQQILKFQDCPVEYSIKARERKMGIFEQGPSKKYEEYLTANSLMENFRHRLPGGESYNQFQKRVVDFIEKIYLNHKNKTVLISTHGGVKRVFLNYLDKNPFNFSRKFQNASLTIVELYEGKKHKIILENCSNYLELT